MLLPLAAHAYDFSHQVTKDGVEYGFHQGDDNGPLLIAISGYGFESDQARSRAAGFDHHLVKPVDLGAIVARLPAPGG